MKLIISLIGICFMTNILAKNDKFEVVIDDDYEEDIFYKENRNEVNENNMGLNADKNGDLNVIDHESMKSENDETMKVKPKTKKSKEASANLKRELKSKNAKKKNSLKQPEKHEKKPRHGMEKLEDKPVYWGEHFPEKYFDVDPTEITVDALNMYINRLNRTLNYFSTKLNKTDVNVGLGLFFTGAIKHCLKTYNDQIDKLMKDNFKHIIRTADNVLSHYIYLHMRDDPKEQEYRVVQSFRDDSILIHSLDTEHFKKGLFKKWIQADGAQMHAYLREMDDATLDKEQYAVLIESMDNYYVDIDESDECISRLSELPYPIPITGPLQRCRPDPYCEEAIHSSPSIAYALSHRMLNLMLRHFLRRCYVHEEEFDRRHLDILCSFMYRESVYVARRGYFSRDMFLEHIALCGLLGYEEFYRPTWFRKAASWVDNFGCITEDRNFEINRTRYIETMNPNNRELARERLKNLLTVPCHHHPMALLTMVLSMAIRYSLHHLT